MIIKYHRQTQYHHFVIKGPAEEEEVTSFLEHLTEILHPKPGTSVHIAIDYSDFEREPTPQSTAKPEA